MAAIRRLAVTLLALSGVVAAVTAVVWGAALAGIAHTSVIATDAMRPALVTGDLVVSTPVSTAALRPGDIISLPTTGATHVVTERVLEVSRLPDGRWSIVARSDADEPTIAAEHIVGAQAWQPTVRVPVVGGFVAAVLEPQLGLPLLALFGIIVAAAMLWSGPRRTADRHA